MRRSLLLLTVPLAAGLSGCGGAPSLAAFTSEADAACDPAIKGLAGSVKPAELDQLRTLDSPGGATKVQIKELLSSMGR